MDSELKDLNSKPDEKRRPSSASDDDVSSKDNRPLLKPDINIQELEKKFAAYVRNDSYGTMGRGPFPVREKILLGVAMLTLVPIRMVLCMTILVLYFLICRVFTLFSAPNRVEGEVTGAEGQIQEDYAHLRGWRKTCIIQCGRFLSRLLLFVVGFYWIDESYRNLTSSTSDKSTNENDAKAQSDEPKRPGAIVSNHISYLDILYHMSSSFPSFVAKRSVGKLPFVGLISKCLSCVFVQRESKSSDFKGVAGVVTERVREAHQNKSAPMMMLFPEGTTTNGDYLLPFKTGAFLAGAPVRPVILRYPYQRFSPAWDTISGVRHVIFLLCQFVNHLQVISLPVYYPSQQEKDDPKLYASNVRRLMADEGNLTLSDIGLSEKRIYHSALNGNNSLPSVFHPKDE